MEEDGSAMEVRRGKSERGKGDRRATEVEEGAEHTEYRGPGRKNSSDDADKREGRRDDVFRTKHNARCRKLHPWSRTATRSRNEPAELQANGDFTYLFGRSIREASPRFMTGREAISGKGLARLRRVLPRHVPGGSVLYSVRITVPRIHIHTDTHFTHSEQFL